MIKNKKQVLKERIDTLNKQTDILETKYKKLKCSIFLQVCFTLIYILFIVFSKHVVPGWVTVIDFELLNLFLFCVMAIYYHKWTKEKISNFKKQSQEGYVLFESVVNYVDWQAYRKKQLHNDNDEVVVDSISRFSRVVQARLSPSRDKGLLVSLLILYMRILVLLAFVFGIYLYRNEFYIEIETIFNQIGEKRNLYYLSALTFAFVMSLAIIRWSYLMRHRLEAHYVSVMNKYLFNFTHLCRFIARFSKCIIYRDSSVEYVEELKSLVDRFRSIGELSIETKYRNDIRTFDVSRLCSLGENVNHLWYYLDDKLRYMERGVYLDDGVAEIQKEDIHNELLSYTDKYIGSKINWGLLRKVTGDFYCDYWQKVENLPYLYDYGRKILNTTRNILVLCMLSIFLLLVITMLVPQNTLQAVIVISLNLTICCLVTYRIVLTRRRLRKIMADIKNADVF